MKLLTPTTFIVLWYFSLPAAAQIDYRYGLGLQVTNPSWGLSGKTNFTDRIGAELIFGPIGRLNKIGLKGLYGITKDRFLHSYAYGLAGMQFSSSVVNGLLGAGAGIEHNWQQWDAKLPPIWFNLELGIGFEKSTKPVIGIGAHYWFTP